MSFVYIIEFTCGLIKVGKSFNPKSRISSHQSSVRSISGSGISRHWISSAHTNYSENELILIKYCELKCDKATSKGREWFNGCSFDEIVCYAEGMSYLVDFDEKRIIDEEKSKACLDKIFGTADEKLSQAKAKLSYECAIKLEDFIRDSLWVGGDIFDNDEKTGCSHFVTIVGAYFYSGDPIDLLIEATSQILMCESCQMQTTHDFYMDAARALAKLWGEK